MEKVKKERRKDKETKRKQKKGRTTIGNNF